MSTGENEEVLLRESFAKLQADFDYFSTYFYDMLFRRAPELRNLFRDDLTGQGMKFITTLGEVVLHAQGAEREAERLAELGTYHASLGVTAENFAPMEEALIDTLKHALGDEFSPELEAAWRKAYANMSATMIKKGAIS